MWCPKALLLACKYLGITLCDTVCQTILPITLLLFLPIYIMYEKTMKGKIQFSYTQPKRQSKTLLSHIGLRRREVWPINSLGYQRTIHLWTYEVIKNGKKSSFGKGIFKKCCYFINHINIHRRRERKRKGIEISKDITKSFRQNECNQSKIA